MAANGDPLVIRKRPRGGKKAAHGGAWKVAFADFTLAMMALFMVLWIMSVSEQKEREIVVQYIKGDLVADGQMNPFDISSNPSLIELLGNAEVEPGSAPQLQLPDGDKQNRSGLGPDNSSLVPGEYATHAQLGVLAQKLSQVIEAAEMGDNVALQILPQGIRILIHDSDEQAMFKLGQAKMQPYFEKLLIALGPLLGSIKNGITLSGHTDALPYVGKRYTNWELSSERALIARQTLETSGVAREQILQVIGMAARLPLVAEDPNHAKNRRIEILVLTKEAADSITGLMLPMATEQVNMEGSTPRNGGQ